MHGFHQRNRMQFQPWKFKSEKLTELFVVRVRNRQIKLSTGVENSLE